MNKLIYTVFFILITVNFISCSKNNKNIKCEDVCNTDNRNICKETDEGIECLCNAGYVLVNDRCEEEIKCAEDSCIHPRGLCTVKNNKIKCLCDAGYFMNGNSCETIPVCQEDSCTETNKNVCSVTNNRLTCSCNPGTSLDENQNCTETCMENSCTENNKNLCTIVDFAVKCICNDGYQDSDNDGICEPDCDNSTCPNDELCTTYNGHTNCYNGPLWDKVSLGDSQACAIREGKIYCWKYLEINGNYNGKNSYLVSPEQIGTSSDWKEISSGYNHTCAINTSKELYCWGINKYYQLGSGTRGIDSTLPLKVSYNDWNMVSAGKEITCGIRNGGELYCWGRNTNGETGDNSVPPSNTNPASNYSNITKITDFNDWSFIDASVNGACGIRGGGKLYCWGTKVDGRIGNDTVINQIDPENAERTPVQIDSDSNWLKVSTSSSNTCAIKKNGSLYCWGGNNQGTLGIGVINKETYNDYRAVPVKVADNGSWSDIKVRESRACGIKNNNLYCWGYNYNGLLALGYSTDTVISKPEAIHWKTDISSLEIAAYSSLIFSEGAIYMWGDINIYVVNSPLVPAEDNTPRLVNFDF